MPPIDKSGFLYNLCIDIGLYPMQAEELSALSWQEIQAFKSACCPTLSQYAASMIKHVSNAYFHQYHASKNKTCPAPFSCGLSKKMADDLFINHPNKS